MEHSNRGSIRPKDPDAIPYWLIDSSSEVGCGLIYGSYCACGQDLKLGARIINEPEVVSQ